MVRTLVGVLAQWLVGINDVSPEHTTCAELGNFHEVVASYTHVELDLLCCVIGRDTCFDHLLEIFISPCESVAEFLVAECTGIDECETVDSKTAVL